MCLADCIARGDLLGLENGDAEAWQRDGGLRGSTRKYVLHRLGQSDSLRGATQVEEDKDIALRSGPAGDFDAVGNGAEGRTDSGGFRDRFHRTPHQSGIEESADVRDASL